MRLKLEWLPGRFAVCRLPPDVPVPDWALRPGALSVITRTDRELSIIVNEAFVAESVQAERGFVALRIVGTLDFNMVGVLATLTDALRHANVPVLAISTYDTDILLVRESDASQAREALNRVAELASPDF